MSNVYYQQGDVILRPITAVPEGFELQKEATRVLQEGETTGHKHQFLDVKNVDIFAARDGLALSGGATIHMGIGKVIVLRQPSPLTHEEHKAITLPPGIYEMDLVREYDYDKEETARVLD